MERDVIISKIGKRGVIVIPKKFRDKMNLSEGSLVILKLERDRNAIVIQPFSPKRVKLGGRVSEIVKQLKREEYELEIH